jgi:hypothetical protein
MIINNYHAMNFISNDFKKEKLTLSSLLEIQSILTKGTLDNIDEEGRFRRDDDEIIVQDID